MRPPLQGVMRVQQRADTTAIAKRERAILLSPSGQEDETTVPEANYRHELRGTVRKWGDRHR